MRAPAGNPFVAFPTAFAACRAIDPRDPLPAQAPVPTAEKLTVRTLRMKGVPEANITAAAGPELWVAPRPAFEE